VTADDTTSPLEHRRRFHAALEALLQEHGRAGLEANVLVAELVGAAAAVIVTVSGKTRRRDNQSIGLVADAGVVAMFDAVEKVGSS